MAKAFIKGDEVWLSDFHVGDPVSNSLIDEWIEKVYVELKTKQVSHTCISTGNSAVSGHRWEDGTIQILVIRNGYFCYDGR